jgi:uncharacterized protein (DUF1810 family)
MRAYSSAGERLPDTEEVRGSIPRAPTTRRADAARHLDRANGGPELVAITTVRAGMSDRYNLQRFVDTQSPVFQHVIAELREGRKTGHWMWFIFPQVRGLGHSSTAQMFGISSLEEARAYLEHPILGSRLCECTRLVNLLEGRSAHQIFGYPDELKFRSSITLFAKAASDNAIFVEALEKYYNGELDDLTLAKL